MKKKEILEIIKNKKTIENSILLPLKNYCDRCCDQKLFDKLIKTYDELKKQYQEDIKSTQEYQEFQNSDICNHPIRKLTYNEESDSFFAESLYECIFCGHSIPGNKLQAKWVQRRYYNNCVFMEERYFKILIEKGYFDILDFLVELLKFKDDNDEIDFIEEFKRLNLDHNIFTINDTKSSENYIMVISSTLENRNEISQNELIFLDRLSKIKGIEVLLFLSEINQVNLSSNLSTTNNIFLKTNKFQLFDVKRLNLPLKIIINLNPNLNFREAIFNKSDASIYMKAIPISQKLKELFPTSQLINLTELNSQAIDEIATYIEKTTNNSKQLDNGDNEYVKKLVR